MRFVRSRFGLVLWCAIALIILSVPLWRLRATRQVQSPLIDVRESSLQTVTRDWKPNTKFGLTDELAQRAARDFPDDVNAQVAALDVTRLLTPSQSLLTSTSYAEYPNQNQLSRAQANLAARAKSGWKSIDVYFARYESLERQFPDSKLVRAAHLQAAMSGTLKINEGPQIIYDGVNLTPRTMLTLRYESWMSPRALEAAIAAARQGAQLESDNAFWPWMEAIMQRSLARNDEVVRALDAAGGKARFDDYSSSIIAARLATLSRLRPIGWEDQWSEISAASDAHFYEMRSLMRAILYETKRLRERGSRKEVFRWAAATARASSVVARDNKTLTGKFVGEALCAIVWAGFTRDLAGAPTPPPQNASESQRKAYYAALQRSVTMRFAQFCRTNGDEILARQTLQTSQNFDGRQLIEQNSSQTNVFSAHIWSLAKLYWLNSQLLRVSLMTVFLWSICWFVTRRFANVAPMRRRMLIPTMFFAGISGALLVAALGFVPALQSLRQTLFVLEPLALKNPPEYSIFMIAWPYSMGALWIVFAFICALRGVSDDKTTSSSRLSWRFLIALTLLCCFVQSLLVSTLSYATQEASSSVMVQIARILWSSCGFIGGILAILWSRGKARPVATAVVCAFWVFVTSLLSGSQVEAGDSPRYSVILFYIAVILIILAFFFAVKNGFFALTKIKSFALNFIVSLRIAAGVLALLSAVTYLGVALWSVPVEAQTRAMMERQLRIGETAWLREQIAAPR